MGGMVGPLMHSSRKMFVNGRHMDSLNVRIQFIKPSILEVRDTNHRHLWRKCPYHTPSPLQTQCRRTYRTGHSHQIATLFVYILCAGHSRVALGRTSFSANRLRRRQEVVRRQDRQPQGRKIMYSKRGLPLCAFTETS